MAAGAPALASAPERSARRTPTSRRLAVHPLVWLASLLLVAFFLRTFRLGAQSLWYDEAYSVFYARSGWAAVVGQQQADPLPYYLLLAGWVRLAGASEYAVRFLSVVLGMLTLPLLYQVGRALGRRRLGLLALSCLSVSAFHVFYSQETRLHILAGLMAAAIAFALLRALRHESAGSWAAYAASAVAGMYSYYYLALLVLGLNLPLLRRRVRCRGWLLANGVAVLAILPGFALAYARVHGFGEPYLLTASPTPLQFLSQAPGYLFLGPAVPSTWTYLATAVVLALTLLALARAVAQRTGPRFGMGTPLQAAGTRGTGSGAGGGGVAALACGVVVAGAGTYALAAAARTFFHVRYEIVVLPGLLALLAWAWSEARAMRWVWRSGAAVLLVGTAVALANGYADPTYQRDDNRGALALVRTEALPDEALIYDLPLQYDVLDYYGRDLGIPAQGLPVPKNPSLPRDRQFGAQTGDRPATEARLAQLADRYAGFWLLLSGDPAQWTEDWLDAHRLPVLSRWFGGTRLIHYRPLPASGPARLEGGVRVEQPFGPLLLRQVRVAPSRPAVGADGSAQAQPAGARPGKLLQVYLAWEATSAPEADYTVSLQLFDEQGARVAQHDEQPFGGALPTSTWRPGLAYEDVSLLRLPASVDSGVYRLDVAVYDGHGTAAGPTRTVAWQAFGLPTVASPRARSMAGWTVDDVASGARPGGGYSVFVAGSVQSRPAADYTWFAHTLSAGGQLLSQDDHPPLAQTSTWQPGDRFGEMFLLGPAQEATKLELGAYDSSGRRVRFTDGDDSLVVPLG